MLAAGLVRSALPPPAVRQNNSLIRTSPALQTSRSQPSAATERRAMADTAPREGEGEGGEVVDDIVEPLSLSDVLRLAEPTAPSARPSPSRRSRLAHIAVTYGTYPRLWTAVVVFDQHAIAKHREAIEATLLHCEIAHCATAWLEVFRRLQGSNPLAAIAFEVRFSPVSSAIFNRKCRNCPLFRAC